MELLPEHSHCLNCDDPVDVGQEYCSDECRVQAENEVKRDRNRNMIFFGIAGVMLVVVTLLVYLR